MRTPLSERATKARRRRQDRLYGFDRYVDASVIIKVVVADSRGEIETPNGLRVREIRRHYRGGVIDTNSCPPRLMPGRWAGPDSDPVVWMVSEDQEPIVLHVDNVARAQIVIGSMGAGKTTALAMWHFLRWIENCCDYIEDKETGTLVSLPRTGLQTAPTLERLGLVRVEIDNLWRPNWGRWVDRDDFTGYELCDGCRIRFVSTYRQSAAQGSRVQGFNASWAGRDEMQDQVDEHEHIEARGRSAKFGGAYYKQLGTATAKDDPDWRTLRDKLEAARDPNGARIWSITHLYGTRSPFIGNAWWDKLKATMSKRMYSMVVECKDTGPERATYPEWSRADNLITVPEIGWTDVTAHELKSVGDNYDVLVGYDPGALWDVSLFLKAFVRNERAYMRGQEKPFWVVLGEVNTEQSSTAKHIDAVLDYVRDRWSLNLLTPQGRPNPSGPQILVRADPADAIDRENAATHQTVYTQFINAGIRIKPAAYNADNDGHGKVPKDPGIEVISTLICDASTPPRRRLFVARNPDGSPAAPMLVRSIEQAKRDERGKAEVQRKGAADISHWTAALRYALWAIERPRLQRLARGAGA